VDPILGGLLGQGMAAGPKLKLLKFTLRQEPQEPDRAILTIQGRRMGVIAWVMNLLGIGTKTELTVSRTELRRHVSSLGSDATDIVPIGRISSMHVNVTTKPYGFLLASLFNFMIGFVAIVVYFLVPKQGESGLIYGNVFVLSSILLVVKFFTTPPTLTLLVTITSGRMLGIVFQPGEINGKKIGQDRLLDAVEVVRGLIVSANGATTSPVDSRSIAEPSRESYRQDDYPDADVEPEDVGDDEETATQMFRDGAKLFKQGRRDEAAELWRRVAEDFPDTTAGQAAKRNLRKM